MKKKVKVELAKEELENIVNTEAELKSLKEKMRAIQAAKNETDKKVKLRARLVSDLIIEELKVGAKPQAYGTIEISGNLIKVGLRFKIWGYREDRASAYKKWGRLPNIKTGNLKLGSIDYSKAFPAEYLSMSDKDILEDVRRRVKSSKKDAETKRLKAESAMRMKEEEMKKALSKLSEHERKLLGIKKKAS